MKARMRTLFEVSTDGGKTYPWIGDCRNWAYPPFPVDGCKVREVRTRWIGPPWPCAVCPPGAH